ncbi:stage V sporulation protein AB [Salirhabdus salicampi]|nr:stage V sporulation protein AB [Salirhabdus salicampi]MCP8616761.1 stage V sporulation protein AB [Salirhabdus salicampi]
MINVLEIIIGLAAGLAVGAGFVAFLTVLGIIPRLIQLAKGRKYILYFEASVVMGAWMGTILSFDGVSLQLPIIFMIIWGCFHGIFIGMLAAGLTEVLNVFPIITKRIGMETHLLWLLGALVFGKIFGSLFQWIIFVQ